MSNKHNANIPWQVTRYEKLQALKQTDTEAKSSLQPSTRIQGQNQGQTSKSTESQSRGSSSGNAGVMVSGHVTQMQDTSSDPNNSAIATNVERGRAPVAMGDSGAHACRSESVERKKRRLAAEGVVVAAVWCRLRLKNNRTLPLQKCLDIGKSPK